MVKISFRNKKLLYYANDDKKGKSKLGAAQFKLYKQRLDQIRYSESLEDLRHQPGRFHELIDDRKGQWACHLNGQYRLVFTPQEDPIPQENGVYIWKEIKAVEIIEIIDYHKQK